jgi:hypothetical protein
MLSPSEYELLVNAVESAGAFPFTSQAEYLLTHYLPKPKVLHNSGEVLEVDRP